MTGNGIKNVHVPGGMRRRLLDGPVWSPDVSPVAGGRLRPLCQLFHLRGEHRHLGHEPLAQEGADDPEVLYDEIGPRRDPLELFAAANARQLLLVAAQQEEPAKLPAVWLEQNRLEALDLTLRLQPGVVLESFVEDLDRLSLTTSHRNPEADKKP